MSKHSDKKRKFSELFAHSQQRDYFKLEKRPTFVV
jgi:hypothetical protein